MTKSMLKNILTRNPKKATQDDQMVGRHSSTRFPKSNVSMTSYKIGVSQGGS